MADSSILNGRWCGQCTEYPRDVFWVWYWSFPSNMSSITKQRHPHSAYSYTKAAVALGLIRAHNCHRYTKHTLLRSF